MSQTISLALAALGIIFAAFVKGVTGLGFPAISIPIAAQFLDPQTTVVAISIPSFLMNVLQTFQGGLSLTMVRRFVPTIGLLAPGAIIGTAILAKVPGPLIIGVLGLIVTVYSALSIWQLRLVIRPSRERQAGAALGFCAGLAGGATGMFAPPLVIYLTALQLPKQTFVAAVSLCFIAGQIPQFVSLVAFRLITAPRLSIAALFCLLSIVGFLLGVRLQQSIGQEMFTKGVLIVLLLVGLNLLRSGFMGFW